MKIGPYPESTATAFPLHVNLTPEMAVQRVEPQMAKNTSPPKTGAGWFCQAAFFSRFLWALWAEMYRCEVPGCAYGHGRTSCLRLHTKNNHPQLPELKFTCGKCPHPFSTAELAQQHEQTCPRPYPLECPLCPRLFFETRNQKSVHLREVHKTTAAEIRAARQQPPAVEPAELPEPVSEQGMPREVGADDAVDAPVSDEGSGLKRLISHVFQDTMVETEVVYDDEGSVLMEYRKSDGYINATQMCQRAGKDYYDYSRLQSTANFLQNLRKELPHEALVVSKIGRHGGTWVHPRVATHMAQWISSKFASKLTGWIETAKSRIPEIKEEYLKELHHLQPDRSRQREREVRERLAKEVNGTQCVMGTYGEIDIVSTDEVIEVKHAPKFAHALGQVLMHSFSYPAKSMRVHLFGSVKELAVLDQVQSAFVKFNVRVTHEVTEPDVPSSSPATAASESPACNQIEANTISAVQTVPQSVTVLSSSMMAIHPFADVLPPVRAFSTNAEMLAVEKEKQAQAHIQQARERTRQEELKVKALELQLELARVNAALR